MKLANHVAIVTGAGRGIGKQTALVLAEAGANIILAARSVPEIEAVADEIRALGRKALAIPTDVTQKLQVESMVKKTYDAFGKVDILIKNAGLARHNLIPDIEEQDWDDQIAVNLKGTFLCTQAVFKQMCEQKYGNIINISSTAGKVGPPGFGAYSAAKFGVAGLTEVTYAEGRQHGVKACLVCPGATDTKMRRDNHPDDVIEHLIRPEAVANLILFLVTQPKQAHIPESIIRTSLM